MEKKKTHVDKHKRLHLLININLNTFHNEFMTEFFSTFSDSTQRIERRYSKSNCLTLKNVGVLKELSEQQDPVLTSVAGICGFCVGESIPYVLTFYLKRCFTVSRGRLRGKGSIYFCLM